LYSISIFNGNQKKYRHMVFSLADLKTLQLAPSETNLEFHFAVPSFHDIIFYSYRILGMHDQWSEYSPDNKVLIHSLPPGTYTLEVRASANGSGERVSTYRLDIVMTAFWYQHWWSIVLMTLVFSSLILMAVRYRYQQRWKRQKALEALRIKISADLHDDVGSILSGLAMQSQVMSYEMDDSKRKPMLELSEMSREAMERMRDTVWAIDARKDKYENLVDRMRDFAEKNLERKNIAHTFTITGLDGKKFISPEVRQNVYLIFKEAITNVIRHSNATQVEISLLQHGEHLVLVVHDNGSRQGLNHRAGQGIGNMMMRAAKIGGRLDINYKEGFKVVLEVGSYRSPALVEGVQR
jgi:signal transduction histidine kinase